LNDLIGKNKSLETSLLDITENMRIQHYLALKALARKTINLQTQLDNFVAEKTHANKHLDELEHHVMLWRYKISFEIETQVIHLYDIRINLKFTNKDYLYIFHIFTYLKFENLF